MKKIIYTLIAFVGAIGFISGQDVSEHEMSMSLGKQITFSIDIDGADEDMTEDVWKKYVKDYGKSKRNKKAREYYVVGAKVPMIAGSDILDLYVKFEERVGYTTANLWIDNGGSFVNSNEYPREAKGAEEFLFEFYLAVKKKAISEEMKKEEKVLNKMDKSLRKLEKKNTGYHEDIEKAKEKIEKAEKNIEQNLKDQEDQRIIIEQQKKIIEEIIERLNNLGKG
ncbi:MAG: vacuolar-type H+-ATPase subunit I/STV1 [Saprospiraceae bacterium]|jgi:vacuolar-type H+-ATPase subunit I/STV1|tara:strand:- start:108 stop:779 length:672 start_codon:yes stop_codon:yes gene_type:complete